MDDNIILMSDSYKVTHWTQYPPGTQQVYSYLESRGGQWGEVVFFGLQYILKRYLTGSVVSSKGLADAEALFTTHFKDLGSFNKRGWQHIIDKHQGRLPIVIKAVPEGTVVAAHNVLMTVENTDPECYWLTGYLETVLHQVWYPCTVATQSREMKKMLKRYLEQTGDPSTAEFKLFDFGYRGSTSRESAAIAGGAHMVSFQASETLPAVRFLIDYYKAKMPAFAAPATEHSTIIAWGREHEADAYANMLRQFPKGRVSVVSDSYDIFHACEKIWGGQLKEAVQSRDGTVVISPDSGDPAIVVPKILELLGAAHGYTTNSKGFKLLPTFIRVFQPDAIEYSSLPRILDAIVSAGWSVDNVAFGSGGGLVQKVNRDTLGFAFKCSNVIVNGVSRDVSKNPATDIKKRSKRGRFCLVEKDGILVTVPQDEVGSRQDRLETVFKDGELLREQSLDDVRARAMV